MKPFTIGWYAVVRIRLDPSSCISCVQKADSNWDPRSVVTVEGTPNLEVHPLTKAYATVSAVMSVIGMASGQRVNRSLQVSR